MEVNLLGNIYLPSHYILLPSFVCPVNRQQFRMLTKEGTGKGHPAVPAV